MREDGLLPALTEPDPTGIRLQDDPRVPYDQTPDTLTWGVHLYHGQTVWRAVEYGKLLPPPPEHVLDALVRAHMLGDHVELPVVYTALEHHPEAGTVGILDDDLPPCDLCEARGVSRKARYDSLYRRPGERDRRSSEGWNGRDGPRSGGSSAGYGGRAYLCGTHFKQLGPGLLSILSAQYLQPVLKLSTELRDAYRRAHKYWTAQGLPLPSHMAWE